MLHIYILYSGRAGKDLDATKGDEKFLCPSPTVKTNHLSQNTIKINNMKFLYTVRKISIGVVLLRNNFIYVVA
jgi:hypothetical protein